MLYLIIIGLIGYIIYISNKSSSELSDLWKKIEEAESIPTIYYILLIMLTAKDKDYKNIQKHLLKLHKYSYDNDFVEYYDKFWGGLTKAMHVDFIESGSMESNEKDRNRMIEKIARNIYEHRERSDIKELMKNIKKYNKDF